MKEGAGMAMGRSAGIGSRGPASGGARGFSQSFGVSLSAEVGSVSRSPVSLNTPSSRPNSIVNINRGKSISSIFDTSRPVRSHPIVPHEARFQFGLNIKNGTELRSKTARTESLKPKGMFDAKRPFVKDIIVPHKIKSTEKRADMSARPSASIIERFNTPKQRESIRNFPIMQRNENVRSVKSREVRVKALEATQVLFDFSNKPKTSPELLRNTQKPKIEKASRSRVRLEAFAQNLPRHEAVLSPKKEQGLAHETRVNVIVSAITKQRNVLEKKATHTTEHKKRVKNAPKRIELKHRYKISPDLKLEELQLIRSDLHLIKKMIPLRVLAEGITTEEAQKRVIQDLSIKHKNKIKIIPIETQPVPAVSPQLEPAQQLESTQKLQSLTMEGIKPTIKGRVEKRLSSLLGKDKKVSKKDGEEMGPPTPFEKKEFYYGKDNVANEERLQVVERTVEDLIKTRGPEGEVITGKDVAAGMKTNTVMKSEVSKPAHIDGSLDAFKKEIEGLGEIRDRHVFMDAVKLIKDKFTAVKLSISGRGKTGEESAKIVYKGIIDKQKAYFEEYGREDGSLNGMTDGTYFVPTSKLQSAPVV